MRAFAATDIPKGAEMSASDQEEHEQEHFPVPGRPLLFNYVSALDPLPERRRALTEFKCFQCQCQRCKDKVIGNCRICKKTRNKSFGLFDHRQTWAPTWELRCVRAAGRFFCNIKLENVHSIKFYCCCLGYEESSEKKITKNENGRFYCLFRFQLWPLLP